MQLRVVVGLLIGFICLPNISIAWGLFPRRLSGVDVAKRHNQCFASTWQASPFKLQAEREYISAIYIGDSLCFDDAIEKKDILRLLDCITSPSDSADDDFDYEKDRIRRDLLRYNDISSLREECHRRDIVPSLDKHELLMSLLLHKLDPSITVNDQRQGAPDPIPTLPPDIFDDLIRSQNPHQQIKSQSFLDALPESEEFRLLRGRPRIAGTAQARPVLLDGLERRDVFIHTHRFLRSIQQAEKEDAQLRKLGMSGIKGYVSRQRVIGSTDMSISSSSVTLLVSDGHFASLEMRLLADEIASSTSQAVLLLDMTRQATHMSQDTTQTSLKHSLTVSQTRKYSDEVRLRQMDDLLSAVLYCSTTLLSPYTSSDMPLNNNFYIDNDNNTINNNRDNNIYNSIFGDNGNGKKDHFQKKNNVQIVAIGETAGVVLETLTLQQCLAVSHAVPEILRQARSQDTSSASVSRSVSQQWEIDEDTVSRVLQQYNLMPLPKMSDHYSVATHDTKNDNTSCVAVTYLGNFTIKRYGTRDASEYTVNWRHMLRDTPDIEGVINRGVSQTKSDVPFSSISSSSSSSNNNNNNNINNNKNDKVKVNIIVNSHNNVNNINNITSINNSHINNIYYDNVYNNTNSFNFSNDSDISSEMLIPSVEEMERMIRDAHDTPTNDVDDKEVEDLMHSVIGEEEQGNVGRSDKSNYKGSGDWMKILSDKIVSQMLSDPRHTQDMSQLFHNTENIETDNESDRKVVSQDLSSDTGRDTIIKDDRNDINSNVDSHSDSDNNNEYKKKYYDKAIRDTPRHTSNMDVSHVSQDPYSRYNRFMSLPERLKKVFQLHDTLRHNTLFQKYITHCPSDSDTLCARHMQVSSVVALYATHYDTAAVAATLRLPVFLLCCDIQLYNNNNINNDTYNEKTQHRENKINNDETRLRHNRDKKHLSLSDIFTTNDIDSDNHNNNDDNNRNDEKSVSTLVSVPGFRREDIHHWTTALSQDYKSFTDISLVSVPHCATEEDETQCVSQLLCRMSPSNLLSEQFPFLFSLEINNHETVSLEQVCRAFQLAVLRHAPPVLLEYPDNRIKNNPDLTQKRTLEIWDSVQSRQAIMSLIATWLDIYSGDISRSAGVAGCFKVIHRDTLGHSDKTSEEKRMKSNIETLVRHHFELDRDTARDTGSFNKKMKLKKVKNKLFNNKKVNNNNFNNDNILNNKDDLSLSLIRKLTFPPLVRDTRVAAVKTPVTRMWSSGDWLRFSHIDTATKDINGDSDTPGTHENGFKLSDTAEEQWRMLEDWKILNKMSNLLHWSPAAVRRLQHWLRHTFSSRDTTTADYNINSEDNWRILKRLAYDTQDSVTDQDRDTLCRWLKEARHCYDTPIYVPTTSDTTVEEVPYLESEKALWQ